ncbi:hypothetical protein HMPREF0043_01045 [Actinobaculum sp. oral taxon 183 str. F0552]|nr:hypothetical protein HMPREF0043_01045 [Actinobaculum sp. oral taxon 183 str. F0552]
MSTLSFSDSTARKLDSTSENATDLLNRMASIGLPLEQRVTRFNGSRRSGRRRISWFGNEQKW